MKTEFCLEIFYELDQDEEFAKKEADKLHKLVCELAPHIKLRIRVHKATKIRPPDERWDIPTHEPVEEGSQTLLIVHGEFGPEKGRATREGRAGPEKGCLRKEAMERKGEDSVDITIHEWIYTITGNEINGRKIPNPDHKCKEFEHIDDDCHWYRWFRHILRE